MKAKAKKILDYLEELYPVISRHLDAENAWELLVATCLAAQCTDARVNQVTPNLFKYAGTPEDTLKLSQEELEELIKSTGFYRNKAKNMMSAAKRVVEIYNGEVPNTMEDLITLAGVARKTANCVLSGAFGINVGIAVDTHVKRISNRLAITISDDPVQIEKDLMKFFPEDSWVYVNNRMVSFGRDICTAKNPKCPECKLNKICHVK